MKQTLLASALLLAAPFVAHADDGDWSGSGELGLAAARGNSKSENVNAKLQFKKEDDVWKDNFYLNALRSKGEVKTTIVQNGQPVAVSNFQLTSNRYEGGASAGFKLDERSYIVGAVRYENDDFSPFQYQWTTSVGYGYTAIKNESTELAFEIGPGYKRAQPIDKTTAVGNPPVLVTTRQDAESEAVGRGLIAYRQKLTDNTAFENTLLVEAGSSNRFLQNDAGLAVNMNKKLALKLGFQVRHNSETTAGTKQTDELLTTNLVYNF